MDNVRELVDRYLDQRETLDETEMARLAEAVERSPELATRLKDQLVLDELLDQRLAIDRQGFEAQVEQRLHDFHSGERSLSVQAVQLRQLAQQQLGDMAETARRRRYYRWLVTVSAAMLVMFAAGYGYWSVRWWQPIATFRSVQGDVRRGGESGSPARVAQAVLHGDEFHLTPGAEIQIAYPDGTRVQARGPGRIGFQRVGLTAKQVTLDQGRLSATVAPQPPGGGMRFLTPLAIARVLGTELALHADADSTRLDVFDGQVELVRRTDGQATRVDAHKYALATADGLAVETATWPLFRDGLIGRMERHGDATARLVFPTHGDTAMPFAPQGLAWMGRHDSLVLSGGRFAARDSAGHLAAELQRTNQWTLEVVVHPKSIHQERPTRILTLSSDDGQIALSLSQEGPMLVLERSGGDASVPSDRCVIGSLGSARPHHLAIRCRGGKLIASINNKVSLIRDDVPNDPRQWQIDRFAIGAMAFDDEAMWQGSLSHLAIYNRFLSDGDLTRQAESAMRAFERRAALRVLVRAVPTSTSWIRPGGEDDLAPSLLVRHFRVVDVLDGMLSEASFVAAYWDVVDSHHMAIVSQAQAERILVLEPIEDYPHVRSLARDSHQPPGPEERPAYFVVAWQ